MPPIYADGDIHMICDASQASCAIPGLVVPTVIDNEEYQDAGISCSSPLVIMKGPIIKYLQSQNSSLHMIYVNSKNLEEPRILPHHNLFDTWKQAVNDLVKSQTLIDRMAAYELLNYNNNQQINKTTFPCNYETLSNYKNKIKDIKYSLLEIYPIHYNEIDITSFDADIIEKNLNELYGQFMCHFWWI